MYQRRWNPRPNDTPTIDRGEIAALVFFVLRWLVDLMISLEI